MTLGKRPMSRTSQSSPGNLMKSLCFQGRVSIANEHARVYSLDGLEGLVEDSSSVQNLLGGHALELVNSSETHFFSFKYIMLTLALFCKMLCQVQEYVTFDALLYVH